MSAGRPTLWHITISHYSEKVRWALDHKSVEHERRAPMPGYHMAVALWLTRGRSYTFPILELDGANIGDSTAIIAALEQRFPDPPLYPSDPDERRRALELEDWFDEQLGPYARRLAFHELRDDREQLAAIASEAAPAPLARHGALVGGIARGFTALRFGAASDRGSERALGRVLAALDRLEAELGSEDYLVGGRFTVADLTAASLFYPIVLPRGGPLQIDAPEATRPLRDSLRERRGFRWVEEMFARHRRAAAGAGARVGTSVTTPTP